MSPRSSGASKMRDQRLDLPWALLFLALIAFSSEVGAPAHAYEAQDVSPVLEMVDADLKRMFPELSRYEVREISSEKIARSGLEKKLEAALRRKLDREMESVRISRTMYLVYDGIGKRIGVVFGMAQRVRSGGLQLFVVTKSAGDGSQLVQDIFIQRADTANLRYFKDPRYLRQFKRFSTERVPERAWILPPFEVGHRALDKDLLEDHHSFVSAVRATLIWLRELERLL